MILYENETIKAAEEAFKTIYSYVKLEILNGH